MRLHGMFRAFLIVLVLVLPGTLFGQGVTPLPAGSVTGVVRMPDGTPAANVRVTAHHADGAGAIKVLVSLAQTDATGRYRLEGVPPGRYYIAAGSVDFPTYFPGTLNAGQGTAVSIASAAIVPDINFTLQEISTRVRAGLQVNGARAGFPFILNPPALNLVPPQRPAPLVLPPDALNAARDRLSRLGVQLDQLNQSLQTRGAWWTNTALVARLGLTADQMKKIEGIFDQRRQTIVQEKASLEKEEAALDRMLDADPMEPARNVSAQIDKVVQARGQMERTSSNMTLEMRQVLTRAQWAQLQAETPQVIAMPLQLNLGKAPLPPGRVPRN